jgi:hypothetical protein
MFKSRSEAMLWVASMVLMVGGGALGYLITGSPWAWAIGGLVLAIVLRIVLVLTVDARSGRWGRPGPHDLVPGRRTPRP